MRRYLPGFLRPSCSSFHTSSASHRQPTHRSSSNRKQATIPRDIPRSIFQDPWSDVNSFRQQRPSRPRASNEHRILQTLSHRLREFTQLDRRTFYRDTLNALGFSNPPPSVGSSSSVQNVALWRALISGLVTKFTSLILQAMDERNTPSTSKLLSLRRMVSDCVSQHKSGIDLPTMDRWIISNFIPWAASECRNFKPSRHSQRQPEASEKSVESALQALLSSLSGLIDMRRPHDKYPEARRYKRQIHLHVGPTNSGKTHSALRALHGAHTGVYAGPLRLLAHEVFTRMNKGQIAHDLPPRACNLITGEEQRTVDKAAGLTSCTVEMLSPHQYYDVVVIDEIQMIGDLYRGDAWTQAVLGAQAKEVHLCGEESVVELIKQLSDFCGDEFVLHRYQRLTPLKVSDQSLHGDLSKVQPGDCVVTFSRNNIYAIKTHIQQKTNLRVGMAYGGLPPEVREREARMFNLGSEIEGEGGYDVLVGSDAIGMGLNLKIKRVIFEALFKFDGRIEVPLSTSQIKQIGGRAGRYGVLPSKPNPDSDQNLAPDPHVQSPGEVATLQESEMSLLRERMSAPFHPIHQAVIKAPFETIQGLARMVHPGARFSTLLDLRRTLTVTSPIFAIGDEKNAAGIADLLEDITNLSLAERDLFCSAPANSRNPVAMSALRNWAAAHAKRIEVDFHGWLRHEKVEDAISSIQKLGQLSDSSSGTKVQNMRTKDRLDSQTLLRLETLHKCLVLYLWLGFRLPETFTSMSMCSEWKTKSEDALALGLTALGNQRTQDRAQLRNFCNVESDITHETVQSSNIAQRL